MARRSIAMSSAEMALVHAGDAIVAIALIEPVALFTRDVSAARQLVTRQ